MPIEGMKDSLKKRHPLRDMKVGKAFIVIVIVVKGTYNRLCDFRIVDEGRDGTEIARPAFLSPLGRLEKCRKDDSEYEGKAKWNNEKTSTRYPTSDDFSRLKSVVLPGKTVRRS